MDFTDQKPDVKNQRGSPRAYTICAHPRCPRKKNFYGRCLVALMADSVGRVRRATAADEAVGQNGRMAAILSFSGTKNSGAICRSLDASL